MGRVIAPDGVALCMCRAMGQHDVPFGVGLGHECGVRKDKMYPLRRPAIDPKRSITELKAVICTTINYGILSTIIEGVLRG